MKRANLLPFGMIDAEGLYNFALQSELLFSRTFPDGKPFSVLPLCIFYFFQEIIYNEQMKNGANEKKSLFPFTFSRVSCIMEV